jgi:hypothetical protein
MKEHQVIEMLQKVIEENTNFTTWTVSTPHLVALVNHAIEAEREACAKICERTKADVITGNAVEAFNYATKYLAKLIRARGQA